MKKRIIISLILLLFFNITAYADTPMIISKGQILSYIIGPGFNNKIQNNINTNISTISVSTKSTASTAEKTVNNISNHINATTPKIGPDSDIYIHDGIIYMKGEDLGRFKLSGYCACEKCGTGTGLTYSGKKVRANHTVAADLSVLPLGTYVILEGLEEGDTHNYDGVYQVEDKGGGVKGKHLDIYQTTHDLAALVTYYGRAYGHVWLAVPINN